MINGIHHLAISTGDMKRQIAFFSDVLGMELRALYWMHGVEGAWHAFLRLNDFGSIAFVYVPGNERIEGVEGISHAPHGGGSSAGGTMQHVSFRVATPEDLLAIRSRIRSHGVPVFGPIDHGMCQSIYFAGPEGLNLEVATSDAPLDGAAWIDPEVAALAGIDEVELVRFRHPAATVRQADVPQPAYDPRKPHLHFPEPAYRKMLAMSDEAFARQMRHTDPPVPTKDGGVREH